MKFCDVKVGMKVTAHAPKDMVRKYVPYVSASGVQRNIYLMQEMVAMNGEEFTVSSAEPSNEYICMKKANGADSGYTWIADWLEPAVSKAPAPQITIEDTRTLLYDLGLRGLTEKQRIIAGAWMDNINKRLKG